MGATVVIGALVLLVVYLARKSPGPNQEGQSLDPNGNIPGLGNANALSPATAVAPTASRSFQNMKAATEGYSSSKRQPLPPPMPGGSFQSPENTPDTDKMLLTRTAPGQVRVGTLSSKSTTFKL